MLKNIYTTKMSASKKQLQNRFSKIRSKNRKFSKIMSSVTALALASTLLFATVTVSAWANDEKNFFVNNKGYSIPCVLIENELATRNDNYYVPLRKTFEALGYSVRYDADKEKYANLMGYYIFPAFETKVHFEHTLDDGTKYINEHNSYEWQKALITNEVDYYIYGATLRMNSQMPVIEMTKDGVTEFCQIGSREYSKGYALSPVLIEGTAYIPIRAVANIIGGEDNVKWDDKNHDTYFEGVLNFSEEENKIVINIE